MNHPLALIGSMSGPQEILLILVVLLLFFGSKKLPELSRSLGKSLSEFRKGKHEGEKEEQELQAGNSSDKEDKA